MTELMLGTVAACVLGMLTFIVALLVSGPWVERVDRRLIETGAQVRQRREERVAQELADLPSSG